MQDIRKHLLPAFIAGNCLAALVHITGLCLLFLVKFKPVNQRRIVINLAWTELGTDVNQIVVYSFLLMGSCGWSSVCAYVDQFFYVLFVGLNKLLIMYMMIDRVLDIHLNMRYPLYFTKQVVGRILAALWMLCAILALAMVFFRKYNIGAMSKVSLGYFDYCFLMSEDVAIVVIAVTTYSFLYVKVRRFHEMDKRQHNSVRGSSPNIRSPTSKFLMPSLITAIYLMFNTTGDVMLYYKTFSLKGEEQSMRQVLSEVGHLLWILGGISDGIVFIFSQRSIKNRLLVCVKKEPSERVVSERAPSENVAGPMAGPMKPSDINSNTLAII